MVPQGSRDQAWHGPAARPRLSSSSERLGMSRQRWMALCFAFGSTCFLVGPFPGYASLVGDAADAVSFFVGSILFTIGGGLQSWLAWPDRRSPGGGCAGGWAALIQSAGTLFFNVTTFQALHLSVPSYEYNK